jgi:alkylresorcinol/alkylpyrone synthase
MISGPESGARLRAVASAMPPHRIDREAAAAALVHLFPDEDPGFIHGLIERSGVEQRFLVPSLEQVLAGRGFTERNLHYREAALELATRAARLALERGGLAAGAVDCLIDVSCTGISIPALDVGLAAALGLRGDVRRIPVTESGCAAGGLALGMASSFAAIGQSTLIVAVELCSLTLERANPSRTNLVAGVLFGDGAAAAVIAPHGPGPRIRAVGSHLIPESEDTMGFDVGTHGMRIVLRRELSSILQRHLPGTVVEFLAAHGRSMDDIGLHLVHPGGRRILDAYRDHFGLTDQDLCFTRESLRRYGNLSSASILTVLELAMQERFEPSLKLEALMVAVGPGLSLELALMDFAEPD